MRDKYGDYRDKNAKLLTDFTHSGRGGREFESRHPDQ